MYSQEMMTFIMNYGAQGSNEECKKEIEVQNSTNPIATGVFNVLNSIALKQKKAAN